MAIWPVSAAQRAASLPSQLVKIRKPIDHTIWRCSPWIMAVQWRVYDRRAVSSRSSPEPLTDEQLAALAEVGSAVGLSDAAAMRAEADAAMAALLLGGPAQLHHVLMYTRVHGSMLEPLIQVSTIPVWRWSRSRESPLRSKGKAD